jgi:hypothetical protein
MENNKMKQSTQWKEHLEPWVYDSTNKALSWAFREMTSNWQFVDDKDIAISREVIAQFNPEKLNWDTLLFALGRYGNFYNLDFGLEEELDCEYNKAKKREVHTFLMNRFTKWQQLYKSYVIKKRGYLIDFTEAFDLIPFEVDGWQQKELILDLLQK